MSKTEAVQFLCDRGYDAYLEDAIVMVRTQKGGKFIQKKLDELKRILSKAGYNASFGMTDKHGIVHEGGAL